MHIYLIGPLRTPVIPELGRTLRTWGHTVFDDWFGAGPKADDSWQEYETVRGRSYKEALKGLAAEHTFEWDLKHIREADAGVLVLPAGKSAHLELGYMIGRGQRGYVFMPEMPKRWDLMYRLAHGVYHTMGGLKKGLSK